MSHVHYIRFNHGSLWTEAFGYPTNPLVVLIMGAKKQGLYWYDSWCQSLAEEGFYVVRFDHRDTGLSSFVDFNAHPYRLDEMMDDVLSIINFYGKKQAHVIGCGMGGYLAQMLAINRPEKVASLVLLMTTHDARSIEQKSKINTGLPGTPPKVLARLERLYRIQHNDPDWLSKTLEKLRILNGESAPFNEKECEIMQLNFKNREQMNHIHAFFHHHLLAKSLSTLTFESHRIKHNTTIIHGDADPLIPVAHAFSMKTLIPHANLEIIQGMGHLLTRFFERDVLKKMIKHLKSNRYIPISEV